MRLGKNWSVFRYYGLIALFPTILFAWYGFNGLTFYWGTPALQFIPWRIFGWELIQDGTLPLWNPLNGMGAPFAANYQSAFFYPPGWFLSLLGLVGGASWIAQGYVFLTIFHLIWAGIGMSRLLKYLGGSITGQLVGAISFELCGYIVARIGFFSILWVVAWMPWVIFTASKIASPGGTSVRQKKIVPISLVLCLSMMFLAGHAQLSWYILIFTSAWVFVGGYSSDRWKGGFSAFFRLVIAVMISALVCSIQLLPTAELLLNSQRSTSVDYETGMTYSFWPWRIITLFSPNFFGNPGTGDYWGYGSFWEDDIYIGLLPILLAFSTLKYVFKRKKDSGLPHQPVTLVRFLWLMGTFGFILALGKNTFIFPFLYKYVITFSMFNAPARYLVWSEFSFVLLAGLAVSNWHAPQGKSLYWFRLATAGGFAITIGAVFTWFFLGSVSPTFIRATALTGIWALGSGLLTLNIPKVDSVKYIAWQSVVILWIGLDLIIADWYLNPITQNEFYLPRQTSANLLSQKDQGRIFLNEANEYRLKFKRFLRFKDYRPIESMNNWRTVSLPNTNLLNHTAMVNNFDPLLSIFYARWMKAINKLSNDKQNPWLRIMGVNWIEQVNVGDPSGVNFTPLKDGARFGWYECAKIVDNDRDAWDLVTKEMEKDWGDQIPPLIIESSSKVGMDEDCPNGATEKSELNLIDENPNRIVIQSSSSSPGWFLLADTWYPGWTAIVDGQKSDVYRAYGTFRAIYLTSGRHLIVFEYSKRVYAIGFILSSITIICIIVGWYWSKKYWIHQFGKD